MFFTWIINIFKGKKKNKKALAEQTADIGIGTSIQEQIESTPAEIAIESSKAKLKKLKQYKTFFNNKFINDIYDQCCTVHDIFTENKELSYKKLDQFHYYYTDNLFELLEKIKKSKEENISLYNSQIKTIESKIKANTTSLTEIGQFDKHKLTNKYKQYSQIMQLQLTAIYNCMVDNYNDFRYKKLGAFKPFFNSETSSLTWTIPNDIFLDTIHYNSENQYKFESYHIERKLMGRLQKNLFDINFIGMCKSGDGYFEVFKINEINEYFIYIHDSGIFKAINFSKIADHCIEKNTQIGQLNVDTDKLKDKLIELKTKKDLIIELDSVVLDTLQKYLTKIEDIDLINKLTEVDIERKNLESILQLTQLEI